MITLIGIVGASGSGKSTLAGALLKAFERAGLSTALISSDDYYRARGAPDANYDRPDALDIDLFIEHLMQLKAAQQIQVPVYDFSTHQRTERSRLLQPCQVVVVEGLFLFSDETLCSQLDIRIFLDVDLDLCYQRRLARDQRERARSAASIKHQYQTQVLPGYRDFIEPFRDRATHSLTQIPEDLDHWALGLLSD